MNDSFHWLLLGHLLGIVVLVGASGIDLYTKLGLLRATTVGEQRGLLRGTANVPKFTAPATILLFGCGVGLILDSHSMLTFGQAWIVIGIVVVVVMSLLEPLVTGRRLKRLETALAAAPDGPADVTLIALARDPVMHTAHRFGLISTIELFYAMTLRPAMWGTLLSAGVMLVITAAVSVPLWRSARGGAADRTSGPDGHRPDLTAGPDVQPGGPGRRKAGPGKPRVVS